MAEDLKDPESKGAPTTYLNIKTHADCTDYKLSADKKIGTEAPKFNKKLEMDIQFPKQSIA
eukprot:CAMPEP_0116900900 /NCGR_PEP_ID=MMETSP0467-20121206/9002_1 /TAXON_ID=283647 /ORGANISM="Mesodinium pulex, Strain SPMC105" /LENGTH=60 /DNA_ID=CAMNT_0004574249 /DNA_START=14 /DNA_END=196 /DNA_ORIENTATION=+